MPKKDINKYIAPLHMNGLNGRMLRLPPKASGDREILLIYGHHTSIERMIGLAEYLHKYGAVTLPDLPGFGGMEPFYKIGIKPTLDDYADYLASFIKLRYKNKRVTIAGFSIGFPMVTRMLQKYPDMTDQIDMLISVVGFVEKAEIRFSRKRYWIYRIMTAIVSRAVPAFIYKHVILRPIFIRHLYRHMYNAKEKFHGMNEQELKAAVELEVKLWRINDPRSYMATGNMIFNMNITHSPINMSVHHIAVKNDRYFNNPLVKKDLKKIFANVVVHQTSMKSHMPSVIASAEQVAPLIPESMRKLLRKKV